MVCYTIPLAVAVIMTVVWSFKLRSPRGWWLNLLLYGGALFGLVDHLWHGELLLISEYWVADLLLGGMITSAIFGGWGITLGIVRISPTLRRYMGIFELSKKR